MHDYRTDPLYRAMLEDGDILPDPVRLDDNQASRASVVGWSLVVAVLYG